MMREGIRVCWGMLGGALALMMPVVPLLVAADAHGQAMRAATDMSKAEKAGAPMHLTAEQDRDRMLKLLGIKKDEMRRPASSDANSPNSANYDEQKANKYRNLPDVLRLNDGRRVTTAAMWWKERRPEIVEDFDKVVLGRTPEHLPGVRWKVVRETHGEIGGVPEVTKTLRGEVDNSRDPQIHVHIDMTLTTPEKTAGPVPAILELAFTADYPLALKGPLPGTNPMQAGHWAVQAAPVLQRGWAFAVLEPMSYQADDGSGLTEGIIGLMNRGQPRKLDDWGVLKAWAWGASRALDYLETDNAVDARQVGIVGHSRLGKTALVAMAYDPRFAIGYISSSGEGGAKLYRHDFGEPLANLESVTEYHWMAGELLKYAGPLNAGDLPVDAHELIALCAPRPLFVSVGASIGDGYANPKGDAWADAKGSFLAEVDAGPVYRLLGAKSLGTDKYPPQGTALTTGALAFRQHAYGHTPAPNWIPFLDFASRYLKTPEAAKEQR